MLPAIFALSAPKKAGDFPSPPRRDAPENNFSSIRVKSHIALIFRPFHQKTDKIGF
jgi:hypothetical protein